MVDGREATWSCSLSVTLPNLTRVSARNMSSKSWPTSTSTSTPWFPSHSGGWHKLMAPAV